MVSETYSAEDGRAEGRDINLRGKTVLQVIPSLETGGAERTTVDIVAGIIAAGGKALVASAGGRLVQKIEDLGGQHISLPLDAKFRLDQHLTNRLALRSICKKNGVDLIHARSRAPAFAARSVAKAASIPFLTTYHGIYSETNALKRWYNSIMVSGEAVIANSHYTKKVVLERYSIDEAKVTVIHRGIDLEYFNRDQINESLISGLRKKWELPEDRPVIILLGRITDWKGHRYALEALEIVKRGFSKPPVLVFAGKAQSETYLQRVKSDTFERGLVEDVFFVGHTDEPALAFATADLAIVPSIKPEAFGRSVAEASACQLPVIAFDHGGARETILTPPEVTAEERTGYRVPLKDALALANAITELLKMPGETRTLMGMRGRRHIENNFSIKRMVNQTLKLYAKLIRF